MPPHRAVARSKIGLATTLRDLLPILLLDLWLSHRFVLSSALPAGTDMLGFTARARLTSHELLSVWSGVGMGSPKTFTVDQLLGAATRVTGDAVVTVKVSVVVLLAITGTTAYFLARRWFASRVTAVTAGLFYMISQTALAQWASGHLNVQVAYSLLPLQLLLFSACLERLQWRRVIALTITVVVVVFTRPDLIVFFAATAAIYTAVSAIVTRDLRRVVRNGTLTVLGVAVLGAALDAYQIVPLLSGIQAGWASGGTLFDPQQLVDHSLPAHQSLAGRAQETGYLGYSGQQTADFHPFLPTPVYLGLGAVAFAVSMWVAVIRRDRRTAFLAVLAVVGTVLATGPRSPLGAGYAFATDIVPQLRNLRVPNRWLMLQALAEALLLGLAVEMFTHRASGLPSAVSIRLRSLRWTAAVAVVTAVLLPIAPLLATGLRAHRVPAETTALLRALADRPGSLVATVPLGQNYDFVDQPGLRGYAQDVGLNSYLFTQRPSLGSGDWSPRSADFSTFLRSDLQRRDPAIGRLLASVGVSDVAVLNEANLATSYQTNGKGDPQLAHDPFAQQTAALATIASRPVYSSSGGAILPLPSAAPMLSVHPGTTLVLGGMKGLADLAGLGLLGRDYPAPRLAGDVIDDGGLKALQATIDNASLLLVQDTSPQQIAAAAAPAAARLGAVRVVDDSQHEPPSAHRDALPQAGQLIRYDSLRANSGQGGRERVTVAHETHFELWSYVQLSAVPGTLRVMIDGQHVASELPLSTTAHGFRWLRLWQGPLTAGTHTVELGSRQSDFGNYQNAVETRLITASARQATQATVEASLAAADAPQVHVLDPTLSAVPERPADLAKRTRSLAVSAFGFWDVLGSRQVHSTPTLGPHTTVAMSLTGTRPRPYFAIVNHVFPTAQDWSSDDYLAVDFHGRGNGQRFEFNVFQTDQDGRVSYPFVDDAAGWRTLHLHIDKDPAARSSIDWTQVGVLNLATTDKRAAVDIALGAVRLVSAPGQVTVPGLPGRNGSLSAVTPAGQRCRAQPLASSAGAADVFLPVAALHAQCRLVTTARPALRPQPSDRTVKVRRLKANSYVLDGTVPPNSVMVLAQAFDPNWQLEVNGRSVAPFPVQGVLVGYQLPAGRIHAVVNYSGNRFVPIGAAISATALFLYTVALLSTGRRRFRCWGRHDLRPRE